MAIILHLVFILFQAFIVPATEQLFTLTPIDTDHKQNLEYDKSQLAVNTDYVSTICFNCLVTVTKFGLVRLRADTTPILLRQTALLKRTHTFYPTNLFVVPIEFSNKLANTTLYTDEFGIRDACISKHYFKAETIISGSHCTTILRKTFAISSRPWNHEIHVVLFPPIINSTSCNQKRFPATLHDIGSHVWENIYVFKYLELSIRLLVFETQIPDSVMLEKGLHICRKASPPSYRTDLLLVSQFSKGTINDLIAYPPCSIRSYSGIYAKLNNPQNQHVTTILNDFFLKVQNLSLWYIDTRDVTVESWELANHHLSKRLPDQYSKFFVRTKLFELWTKVFAPNHDLSFSHHWPGPEFCQISIYKIGVLSTDDITFNYQVSRLRFLACGDTKNLTFLYDSVLSVFDTTTWLLILFILFIASPAAMLLVDSTYKRNPKCFIRLQFAMLKVLLEQSTEITSQQTINIKAKILFMTATLGFLIISNEYKNGEIAQVVSPSPFVPFENFSQLIAANYQVFTELDIQEANVISLNRLKQDTNKTCDGIVNGHYLKCDRLIDNIGSEIRRIVSQIFTHLEEFLHSSTKEFDHENLILNNTKLPAETHQQVELTMLNYSEETNEKLQNVLIALQKTNSVSKLLPCNNTAVFVYEPQIWKYENILRMNGITKISVGKEKPIETRLGFKWNGWRPPYVLQRIRALESTGILNWWCNLATVYLPKIRTESELEKDNTSLISRDLQISNVKETYGNFVYFTQLFMIGLGVSGFCLLAEVLGEYWRDTKFAKHSFICFRLQD